MDLYLSGQKSAVELAKAFNFRGLRREVVTSFLEKANPPIPLRISESPDVSIADVGALAGPHSKVNASIRALMEKGHETLERQTLEGFEGVYEIHIIGNTYDMFIDPATGQRAHAGGISTIGSDNPVKRLWIAKGYYDKYPEEALSRLKHEAVELNLWWEKTGKLLRLQQIRAPGDESTDKPLIREWISDNIEEAQRLQLEFHNAAQQRFPVADNEEADHCSRLIPDDSVERHLKESAPEDSLKFERESRSKILYRWVVKRITNLVLILRRFAAIPGLTNKPVRAIMRRMQELWTNAGAEPPVTAPAPLSDGAGILKEERINRALLVNVMKEAFRGLVRDPVGLRDTRALETEIDELMDSAAGSQTTVAEFKARLEQMIRANVEMKMAEGEASGEVMMTDEAAARDARRDVAGILLFMAAFMRNVRISANTAQGAAEALFRDGDSAEWMSQTVEAWIAELAKRSTRDTESEKVPAGPASGKDIKIATASTGRNAAQYFGALGYLAGGRMQEGVRQLLVLKEHLEKSEEPAPSLLALVSISLGRILTIDAEGHVQTALGEPVDVNEATRTGMKTVYSAAKKGHDQSRPVYLDFIGHSYVNAQRDQSILAALAKQGAGLGEGQGITLTGSDGARLDLQLQRRTATDASGFVEETVIQVSLTSLARYYESLKAGDRVKGFGEEISKRTKPHALVLTGGTLGIDIRKSAQGIVIAADSKAIADVYDLIQKTNGRLKLAVAATLPEELSDEDITSITPQVILQQLADANFAKTIEEISTDVHVEFIRPQEGEERFGETVRTNVISSFVSRGTPLDADNPVTFVIAEAEAQYYRDIEHIRWIVEGALDAKKLLLLAEIIASGGSNQNSGLVQTLREADPETVRELSERKITTPKRMLEDYDLMGESKKEAARHL